MKDYPIIVNKKIVLIDDNQRIRLDKLAEDATDCCDSQQCDNYGFYCSREHGHKGPHVAHGSNVVAVWTEQITLEEREALVEEKYRYIKAATNEHEDAKALLTAIDNLEGLLTSDLDAVANWSDEIDAVLAAANILRKYQENK